MANDEDDPHTMTPMEEVKLKDLFNKIDKNRDGKIDIKDLSTALSEMKVAQVPGHAKVVTNCFLLIFVSYINLYSIYLIYF